MNGLRARAFRYFEYFVDPEIRLRCRRRTDVIGLVGFADVERGTIDIGIDGDSSDAHFAAGAEDAHRDLTSVGDQNLLEHFRLGGALCPDSTRPRPRNDGC